MNPLNFIFWILCALTIVLVVEQEVQSFVSSDCAPSFKTTKKECEAKLSFCESVANLPMKW
jgi:hypothetical protein